MTPTNPITWQDVTALASELGEVPTAARTAILAHVNAAFNPRIFKPNTLRLIRINLAAHLATLVAPASAGDVGGGAVAGPITSEEVGGIKRTYADTSSAIAASSTGTDYDLTEYGSVVAMLVRTSSARMPFVIR